MVAALVEVFPEEERLAHLVAASNFAGEMVATSPSRQQQEDQDSTLASTVPFHCSSVSAVAAASVDVQNSPPDSAVTMASQATEVADVGQVPDEEQGSPPRVQFTRHFTV